MIKRAFFIILTLFIFSLSAYAQEISPQEEIERLELEYERFLKEELETLKQEDPELYEQRKRAIERQREIDEAISSFYKKEIKLSQAEKRLYPLIKEDVQEFLEGLDTRIEMLKNQLSELERIKEDPEILIQSRINRLLGEESPRPEEFLFY